jgi:hypothetical protein
MKHLVLAVLTVMALGSALVMSSVNTSYGNPGDEKPKAGIESSQTQP